MSKQKHGKRAQGNQIPPLDDAVKKTKGGSAVNNIVIVAVLLAALLGVYLYTTQNDRKVDKVLAEVREEEESYIKKNSQWLEDNKTKPGVVVLPSGLQYKIITKGEGKVAQMDDNVMVRYEGRLIDGTVFDSSYKRKLGTAVFKPSEVVKGGTEALCVMPEGSKWEIYVPRDLGYGGRATGAIKPFSTLIFTLEVVKVNPPKD